MHFIQNKLLPAARYDSTEQFDDWKGKSILSLLLVHATQHVRRF